MLSLRFAYAVMDKVMFQKLVWEYYRTHGRHLPWRTVRGVYRILVSEVMLQQTQVDRVIPYYRAFLKKFPTARKLAEAPLSEVLMVWQGLGYNRRAKMLHEAAGVLAKKRVKTVSELEALPGVGPYTARAVMAFAYNSDEVFVETNIRTVIIHHFFATREVVSDKEIEEVLRVVLPNGRARAWYSALMDYGSSLKRARVVSHTKSTHYVKQSSFKGSLREVRGALLRRLMQKKVRSTELLHLFSASRAEQVRTALHDLEKEGMIKKSGGKYSLAP